MWRDRPEEEGITTDNLCPKIFVMSWRDRPEEEGITTPSCPSLSTSHGQWRDRPEEEGITTTRQLTQLLRGRPRGETDLKKKGLRLETSNHFNRYCLWRDRPEEEGITTCLSTSVLTCLNPWRDRPEEEGIKTNGNAQVSYVVSEEADLKKKGLRPASAVTSSGLSAV